MSYENKQNPTYNLESVSQPDLNNTSPSQSPINQTQSNQEPPAQPQSTQSTQSTQSYEEPPAQPQSTQSYEETPPAQPQPQSTQSYEETPPQPQPQSTQSYEETPPAQPQPGPPLPLEKDQSSINENINTVSPDSNINNDENDNVSVVSDTEYLYKDGVLDCQKVEQLVRDIMNEFNEKYENHEYKIQYDPENDFKMQDGSIYTYLIDDMLTKQFGYMYDTTDQTYTIKLCIYKIDTRSKKPYLSFLLKDNDLIEYSYKSTADGMLNKDEFDEHDSFITTLNDELNKLNSTSEKVSGGMNFQPNPYAQPQVPPFGQLQPNPNPYEQPQPNPYEQPQLPPLGQPQPNPYAQPQVPPFGQLQPNPYEQSQPNPYAEPQPNPYEQPQPNPYEQPQPNPYEQPQVPPFGQPEQPQVPPFGQPEQPQYPQTEPEESQYPQTEQEQPQYPQTEPEESQYETPIEDIPIQNTPVEDTQFNIESSFKGIIPYYTNNIIYVVLNYTSISSIPKDTHWVTVSEIETNQNISYEIKQFFQQNEYMKTIHDAYLRPLPNPKVFYLSKLNDSGDYENIPRDANSVDFLIPRTFIKEKGNFFLFSKTPILSTNESELLKALVFIDESDLSKIDKSALFSFGNSKMKSSQIFSEFTNKNTEYLFVKQFDSFLLLD
jgi:hypothetical protein